MCVVRRRQIQPIRRGRRPEVRTTATILGRRLCHCHRSSLTRFFYSRPHFTVQRQLVTFLLRVISPLFHLSVRLLSARIQCVISGGTILSATDSAV